MFFKEVLANSADRIAGILVSGYFQPVRQFSLVYTSISFQMFLYLTYGHPTPVSKEMNTFTVDLSWLIEMIHPV
jgi:hypothetical protein